MLYGREREVNTLLAVFSLSETQAKDAATAGPVHAKEPSTIFGELYDPVIANDRTPSS
jgi:hypothetical protein